jgi:large subunit ribosomal protein L30
MRWHRKIHRLPKNLSPIAQLPSLGEPTGETIKIQQVRSPLGRPHNQGETLKALGLRRTGQIVERVDDATTHGMIRTVQHLVRIIR